MTLVLRGTFVALATPFRNGLFDPEAFEGLCASVVDGGVEGLVPVGTTGEAATLSADEVRDAIRIAVRAKRNKLVIAGASSNSTAKAIESVALARELGADGALVVTPYYVRPSQEGLVAHYAAIARAVPGFPLVAYNVPTRTGSDLLPSSYPALAEIPELVAVKEATGNMRRVTEIRALVGDRFRLLSGDDLSLLSFLALGGDGVIGVSANVVPAQVSELVSAALTLDYGRAQAVNDALAPLHLALADGNPIPVKAALHLLGRFTDEVRLPLVPAPTAARERIASALAGLGLLT